MWTCFQWILWWEDTKIHSHSKTCLQRTPQYLWEPSLYDRCHFISGSLSWERWDTVLRYCPLVTRWSVFWRQVLLFVYNPVLWPARPLFITSLVKHLDDVSSMSGFNTSFHCIVTWNVVTIFPRIKVNVLISEKLKFLGGTKNKNSIQI